MATSEDSAFQGALLRTMAVLLVFIAAIFAIAIYLLASSSSQTSNKLLPPGTYATIEEAEKAAGFKIPYSRGLEGWQLQQVDIQGPESLIAGEGIAKGLGSLSGIRFVDLEYTHVATRSPAWVTSYLNPGVEIEQARTAGSREITISGRRAILDEQTPNGGSGRSYSVQWRQGELWVGAFVVLFDNDLEFAGVLAFLESIR